MQYEFIFSAHAVTQLPQNIMYLLCIQNQCYGI